MNSPNSDKPDRASSPPGAHPAENDPTAVPANEVDSSSAAASVSPLSELTEERNQLQDQLLRTRAEMENMRKRLQRERDEERRFASLPAIRDLLPSIDNLERAVTAGEKEAGETALVQGVKMVLKQLEETLARHGAEPIPALGLPFDPHLHEALQQAPTTEYPPMTVMQELQRGYRLHDRVIRPSQVIVAAAPETQK